MATQTSHIFHGQDNKFLENHCMRRNNDRDPKKQLNQKNINERGQKLDNGLLVTHINQTQDLLRLQGDETQLPSAWEDSEDWLLTHNLKSMKLTLADLISQGTAMLKEGSNVTRKMHISTQTIHQFESKLSEVGILIDVSAVSSGPQKEEFQNDFMSLIDEQLSHKEKLYVLSFGTTTTTLWPSPVEVGTSSPDQPSEILSEYIQQSTMGRDLITHIVTYKCDDQVPPAVLKNLAEALGGYYHCYSPETEIYSSREVDELLAEIQKAQSLRGHVQALHQSAPWEEPTGLMHEISTEIAKRPLTSLLPKPPKHEDPLTIEFPNLDKTSAEWLKTNSLKAKKLSLYQVLAPNAFSPVEEFVPILRKTVSSTIYEKAMVQFEWHDGTMKNIHVDLPFLYEYQKQLSRATRMYERRIEWLSLASRRIWGTVCEKRVVILLDISVTNSMYIIHIQHSLRLLLEEQLSNKDCFNIIAFGSTIESWRPEMVAASHSNLQSAWRWVLSLQCQGSRNVLSALRKAVEVDFKDKDKQQSQGIYLFTGGIPDQDMAMLSAYMAEARVGCDFQLNVCLFYVGESQMDTTPPACYASRSDTAAAYREVTRAAGGRFHWFGDTVCLTRVLSEEPVWKRTGKCSPPERKAKDAQAEKSAQESIKDDPAREKSPPLKALLWSPLSGKAGVPPGFVYRKYPRGRGLRRTSSSIELPRKDTVCSSREWVANYGLKKLKMEISRYLGPNCTHQKSIQTSASAKYCSIFPSIEINGMVRHIQCTPREIEAYITHLEKVMRCYVQRLQWLLSGEPSCYPGGRRSVMGSGRATPGTPGSVLPRLGTHRLSARGNVTSGFRGQARCRMTGR
eukprot:bmy_12043T0